MRKAALFLAFALTVVPFSVSATTASNLDTLCKGYTGDPSGSASFDQSGDASIMDTFLKRKVLCPSACFDVKLTLSVADKKLQIVTSATNKCTNPQTDAAKIKSVFSPLDKPNDTRNCSAGKGLPSVTATTKPIDAATAGLASFFGYSIPEVLKKTQTVGPKSRCDQNVADVIASFTSNGNNGLDVGFTQLSNLSSPQQAAPQQSDTLPPAAPATNPGDTQTPKPDQTQTQTPAPTTPDTNIAQPPATPSDKDALSQLLTDKYGVPADQAKSLVESDADKVKDMIQKSQTNDTAGAQAIAKELKLNDDVINNIAQMTPPKQMTIEEAKDAYQQQQQDRQNQQSTFDTSKNTTGLATQCGTDGLAGNIMRAESNCGQINSNPLSSVQGPYHFLCSTWQSYANSTGNGQYADCSYRNDPTISTQVMNAKMDQYAQQYGSQCTSAGLSLSSCQYAIHVFGEGGFKQMYNAYISNPNDSSFSMCGTALSQQACSNNASIFRNGGTVAGVFNELDRRLGGNGTVITSMASNGSPFTGVTSGNGLYYQSGSPFSGVNPLYYNSAQSVGTSYPTGGTSGSPFSYVNSFFGGNGGGATTQIPSQPVQISYPTPSGSNPSVGQQAVVSIVAQPQNVYRGNYVVVSWSSVGMRTDAQCIAFMIANHATTTLGIVNDGSKIITATSSGLMTFSVACNPLNGQPVVRSTNVAVQ